MTVTNDTLFGRDDYGFGLVSMTSVALPLTLNGKTLTFKSSKGTGQSDLHLPFRNVQGNGPGTLVISDYVRLYPKNATSTLPEVTLVIDTLGRYLSANSVASPRSGCPSRGAFPVSAAPHPPGPRRDTVRNGQFRQKGCLLPQTVHNAAA